MTKRSSLINKINDAVYRKDGTFMTVHIDLTKF